MLESFCPRFTPGGVVLYIGDAGDKFIINETQKFREMGIELYFARLQLAFFTQGQ
ncbi:BsuBI/PstI family type II restriction endonuclease [Microcystis aeruginosa]|uniref:BsuBI/PstI family type II restriction endonuclease n=1 Tax=Microcystis aeruginosa TaxID=1126 RepID=UPI002648B7EE|nr:BsuBI/PstI family type II restriction endonuclease [Microcystis aeruginosa]